MKTRLLVLLLALVCGANAVVIINPYRFVTAGPPAFVPTDIAGVQLWLNADSEAYSDTASGTNFHDRSGNSRDFTEATNPPTFKTGIINGKAVMRLDGTNDQLVGPAFNVPTTGTLFIVCTIKETISTGRVPILRFGDSVAVKYLDAYSYDNIFFAGWYNNPSESRISFTTTTYLTVDVPFIYTLKWTNGSATEVYINGTSRGTAAAAYTWATSGADGVFIGRDGASEFGQVDVAEIIIYDTALNDTDRGTVRTYLNSKYAIF